MNTMESLIVYTANSARARARQWGELAPEVRRRRAVAAAAAHDAPELGELACAYVLLRSRAHDAASDHTLRAYMRGVAALVESWAEYNLLHPPEDAGDRWVGELSRTLSPATIEVRLAAAAALYRGLRWARATAADPFAGVHAPRNPTPRYERRRPYTDGDVQRLLDETGGRLRLVVLLCAHAGLRISEALALRWEDVGVGATTIRVRSGKGRKARTVHCSATLRLALVAGQAGGPRDAVITRLAGGPATDASWMRRQLAAACDRARVDYLGWHALRHTAGTRLARETGSLQLVAAHLGHADVSTAAIYAHWSDETLAAAVAAW